MTAFAMERDGLVRPGKPIPTSGQDNKRTEARTDRRRHSSSIVTCFADIQLSEVQPGCLSARQLQPASREGCPGHVSRSCLEVEANRKLPLPRAAVHSKNLAEVGCANRGSPASAPLDVIVVTVEHVVELRAKRQSVLSIGSHREVF